MIASTPQLAELLPQIESVDRVAIDTEADSLHCYREKLCLLQISVPEGDYVVDPLADFDLAPLCGALERKEVVLHGADFDLRLLRRVVRTACRCHHLAVTGRLRVRNRVTPARDPRGTRPSAR